MEDSEKDWLPLDVAFLGMGLRIYEPDDRMVWEYYLSPLVRVKLAGDDLLSQIPMRIPHRVRENGQIELLPSGSLAGARVSREDIERAANNPYLFDSLAWTALDVKMRRLIPLYADAETKPVPPEPDRAVEPYRSMSPKDFRILTREYLDQVDLNHEAGMVEPLGIFWPFLVQNPALFDILSPAWLVRRKTKLGYKDAVVAPLFAIKHVSALPEWLRDPWWFEGNVKELVYLEKNELGISVAGAQINRSANRGRAFFNVFDPASTHYPALVMMYAGIENRQRAILRKQPHQRVQLEQTRCQEPTCAAPVYFKHGRPNKFCRTCISQGRTRNQESLERALHRDRQKRRQRGLKT